MKRVLLAVVTIASITAAATSADARPKHRTTTHAATVTCDARGCSDNPAAANAAPRMSRAAERRAPRQAMTRRAQRAAQAQSRDRVTCNARGCSDSALAAQATATASDVTATTPAPAASRRAARTQTADANGNGVILGGRPSGCPHRFCGCEASLYVFGEIRKDLNLAANWARKFPRTQPAPGMVAARSGHVFVLMSHVEGSKWMVHDGNSGGGKTRRHIRSIAGYAIVNPHASRYAAN